MWKHKESKWLVRGGRKVKCYLCGKKILAKGDLFLSHQDTGYYSHQSCQAESTTISGNERRRAVKKIAVGAAVVGAIAAGAGKLIDISSQSKGSNSPAAQTILTSQGLIPPALTSDPANPVPGQMWYRSDTGVEAHFDGVQNRVVYSSEINDGNVHVTSKGIINGLSVLPNDGTGWFGPDTTEGATAPGQHGSPYTETYGGQEAVDYLTYTGGKIVFASGVYQISAPILIDKVYTTYNGFSFLPSINIEGEQIWQEQFFVNPVPSGTFIQPTSSFPKGSYLIDVNPNTAIVNTSQQESPSIVGFSLSNITLYGTFGNTDSNANIANGFRAQTSFSTNLTNVAVEEPYQNGIVVLQSGATGNSAYIQNCVVITAPNVGIACNTFESVVIGCSVVQGGTSGNTNTSAYLIGNATTVVGCVADSAQGIAYATVGSLFNNGSTVSFIGCQQVGEGLMDSFLITGTVVITGCYLGCNAGGNGRGVISIGNGAQVNISNCIIAILSANWLMSISGTGTQPISSLKNCTINNASNISGSPIQSSASNVALIVDGLIGLTLTPTISTNPPVSGTSYQNTNPYKIRLKIPVTYSPTSTAAATLATGISSSSTVTTSTKVSYPAGITTGIINTYEMVLAAGQYFELVVTNATIGTVEVQAA